MSPIERHPVGDDRAAGFESGREHRLDTRAKSNNQYPAHLRRQLQIEKVCRVPRLVAELLDEIGRHHGLEDDIADRLERYAALDHGLLAAVGGDRFAASPVRLVGSVR